MNNNKTLEMLRSMRLYGMYDIESTLKEQTKPNYDQIKADVQNIADIEITHIKADSALSKLIR